MQLKDVKIGQRVRYVGKTDTIEGLIGTCVYIDTDKLVTVEFDSSRSIFHTCMGLCKANRGYWCKAEALEPLESEEGKIATTISQGTAQIENLKGIITELFSLGLSGQDVIEVVGAICKAHFAEEGLEKRITTLKEKVIRCQS